MCVRVYFGFCGLVVGGFRVWDLGVYGLRIKPLRGFEGLGFRGFRFAGFLNSLAFFEGSQL